jgi:WD40 repeat protein
VADLRDFRDVNAVNAVKWSPKGKSLASASDDDTLSICDASTGQCLSTLSGHSDWSDFF